MKPNDIKTMNKNTKNKDVILKLLYYARDKLQNVDDVSRMDLVNKLKELEPNMDTDFAWRLYPFIFSSSQNIPDAPGQMNLNAYFQLLQYDALEFARKQSEQASKEAKTAIKYASKGLWFAGFGLFFAALSVLISFLA